MSRFKLSVAVYLVLMKDDKVLLLRRYNTGWMDGHYSMVSGHIDGGAPLREEMVREAKEEAGITIDPKDLRVVHALHRQGNNEYVDFFLTTDTWEGDPQNMEPDKCDDLSWFALSDLPENTLPYVAQVIECIKNDVTYSEYGWQHEN